MSDAPARIDPVAVRSATFPGSFRKYDSRAVDQYLAGLADQLTALNNHLDDLERQATAPRLAAEPATTPVTPAPRSLDGLSEDEIVTLVGEETAHVLATARRAAEDIRAKAEESAARMIREATTETTDIREQAREEAAVLRAEAASARDDAVRVAEAEAATVLERASEDAERRIAEARTFVDGELVRVEEARTEAATDAERIREEAREEGRSMVTEAKAVRSRILEDLQRRRDLARDQIERMVAGRDRLLDVFADVREEVDGLSMALAHVLDEPLAPADPALTEGFVGIVSTTGPVRRTDDGEGETADPDTDTDSVADTGTETAADEQAPATEADTDPPEPGVDAAGVDDPPDAGAVDLPDADADADGDGDGSDVVPKAGAGPSDLADSAADRSSATNDADTAEAGVGDAGMDGDTAAVESAADVDAPEAGTVASASGSDTAASEPEDTDPEATEVAASEISASDGRAGVRDTGEVDDLGDDLGHEASGNDSTTSDVDALFARIRSDREASVARAQAVLDAADGRRGDVADLDAAPEPGDAQAPDVVDPVDAPPTSGDGSEGTATEETDTGETDSGEVTGSAATTAAGIDDAADDAAGADVEAGAGGGDVDRVDSALLAPIDVVTARDGLVAAHHKTLTRALKRLLADEQNAVLDELRRSESTDLTDVLPSVQDHALRYAAVARTDLAAVATAAADDADVDIDDVARSLGAALIEPFRRRLARAAEEVDGDHEELDERFRALFREWKVDHIGPAATDALLGAHAAGQLAAASGRTVLWRIDPAQGPCPDAEDNALGGAVAAGEEFPTGDTCPQAHAGCRCVLVLADG